MVFTVLVLFSFKLKIFVQYLKDLTVLTVLHIFLFNWKEYSIILTTPKLESWAGTWEFFFFGAYLRMANCILLWTVSNGLMYFLHISFLQEVHLNFTCTIISTSYVTYGEFIWTKSQRNYCILNAELTMYHVCSVLQIFYHDATVVSSFMISTIMMLKTKSWKDFNNVVNMYVSYCICTTNSQAIKANLNLYFCFPYSIPICCFVVFRRDDER